MEKDKLFVSFSGGLTSGYMRQLIQVNWLDKYDVVTLFANTGQEHEKTLEFVRDCDNHLGFKTVWVEAAIQPGRKGTTHRIVDFDTASRNGEPFEAMIKKYGIPNQAYPHCTRELKLRPMESYIKSLGWTDHKTAVGIRDDERRREAKDAEQRGIIYPLIYDWVTDKEDVEIFWEHWPFALDLPAHQGNCVWCWKKTDSKHYRIIQEMNEVYDFPARMEEENGLCGNGSDLKDLGARSFFRKHRTTADLRREAQGVSSDHLKHMVNDVEPSGCTESCEAYV